MKTKIETITPQIAAKLLESNLNNRPLTEAHVASLVKEMKNGRWKVNGDNIRISDKHVIIDGQHRLNAIVKSGVTIQSWVMRGLSDDVFDTIDVGKRRSAGDTLGCRGEKNAHRLCAALIMVDKYMTGRVESSVHYSNTEVEDLLLKYPDIRSSLFPGRGRKGLIRPSVFEACHYLFSKKDTAMAESFLEKVERGTGLTEGDPWYVLRERLLHNSLSAAKLSKPLEMALCIKAWNAARQGKQITKLVLNLVDGRLESFPVVL